MSDRRFGLALAAVMAVASLGVGCRADRTKRPARDAKTSTSPGETQAEAPSKPIKGRRGAGHTANIDLVALAPDGQSALSKDTVGGVRLWPVLDGSEEPIAVPTRGPRAMSVAARKDGWLVAVVEPSGGGKVFSVDRAGNAKEVAELPPFAPLFELHVLPEQGLVALYKDHSIRLHDDDGTELAKHEERRFRPDAMRVSAGGKVIAALISTRTGPKTKVEVQRFSVTMGKAPKVARLGSPRLVNAEVPLSPSMMSLSADGKRFAAVSVHAGGKWKIPVVDLDSTDGETAVEVTGPNHIHPAIGFASPGKLLVSPNDGTMGWLVELATKKQYPRVAQPQDFVSQGKAQAIVSGRQVAAHGMWLFSHDIASRTHVYLGYRTFQTQSVAVSPSGKHVAWAYLQGPVYVEPMKGDEGETARIETDPAMGTTKVRFVDDDHIVAMNNAGGVRMIHWRTGRIVGHAGVIGSVRNVDFDPEQGLLLIDRHNNDSRLFEVDTKRGFIGPYIIADGAYRVGLLRGGKDKPVVWTLDSANKIRHYTLAELRKDPDHAAILEKGEPLTAGAVAPLAMDRDGRRYGVKWNGAKMELFVATGDKSKSAVASQADITQIVPSPSGKRFLAVHQRGQNSSVSIHDRETMDELWSYSTGVFHNEVQWSPDERFISLAANSGAVVLDATTGKPARRRCGLDFEAAGSPPASAFNSLNVRSMCEM